MNNLANILTITRLILLPIMIGLFYVVKPWALWACLGLYVIGAITDFLDGWVARKYNQISDFGTFLDPIADKVFVISVLVMLIAIQHVAGLWLISALIIIGREFLVSGLREFLGPKGIKLPVTKLAKWKTTFQMIATGILIIGPLIPYGILAGNILLTVAAIITVITGIKYLKASAPHIMN